MTIQIAPDLTLPDDAAAQVAGSTTRWGLRALELITGRQEFELSPELAEAVTA